jgi:hypothetical protein
MLVGQYDLGISLITTGLLPAHMSLSKTIDDIREQDDFIFSDGDIYILGRNECSNLASIRIHSLWQTSQVYC